MLEFFDQVTGFFDTIFTLLENTVKMLFIFFNVILEGIALPFQFTLLFPGFLGAAILIFVILYVIKGILGR